MIRITKLDHISDRKDRGQDRKYRRLVKLETAMIKGCRTNTHDRITARQMAKMEGCYLRRISHNKRG